MPYVVHRRKPKSPARTLCGEDGFVVFGWRHVSCVNCLELLIEHYDSKPVFKAMVETRFEQLTAESTKI